MSVDKLVDSTQLDSDLTSVANAIRTKGGTSGQLAFPNGFVSAVQNIPTGITPSGTKIISITENGARTEDVTNYASAQITTNVPTPTGTKNISITQNGTTTEDVTNYASASITVNVPTVTPTGTKQISVTQNGTVTEDVTNYASAEITTNVPQMQRIILRPDAELWKSWTYDKRIVADEGITIPAYQTTTVTLKATEEIEEVTADAANYKYFFTFRTLVIPEYNKGDVARGRFEWSSMVGAYEFVFTPMAELHPLVDGTYTIATNSAAVQGGVSYRALYFSSATGISIYATTSYGIWTTAVSPGYVSGKIRINSPNFTMRAQANIFDQFFYEALTDIRFQYVYELWRVPIGSLQYDGWSNQQLADKALDCLYSANHKLT